MKILKNKWLWLVVIIVVVGVAFYMTSGGDVQTVQVYQVEKDKVDKYVEDVAVVKSDADKIYYAELNGTLKSYDRLLMRLKVRQTEIASSLARCDHLLRQLSVVRLKLPKTLYDAKAWRVWQAIVDLRHKYGSTVLPFRTQRGILVRPVPGTWLRDRTGSKGVYISAKPHMNVRSPAGGTVRFTGKVKGYGEVVVVEHRESYYSLIGRLEQVAVKTGQVITKGHIVAKAAQFGTAPYVPVYYELRKGTTYLDPKIWLR